MLPRPLRFFSLGSYDFLNYLCPFAHGSQWFLFTTPCPPLPPLPWPSITGQSPPRFPKFSGTSRYQLRSGILPSYLMLDQNHFEPFGVLTPIRRFSIPFLPPRVSWLTTRNGECLTIGSSLHILPRLGNSLPQCSFDRMRPQSEPLSYWRLGLSLGPFPSSSSPVVSPFPGD